MKKLIISESENTRIKKLYGIIEEQKYKFNQDLGNNAPEGKQYDYILIGEFSGEWVVWVPKKDTPTNSKDYSQYDIVGYVPKYDELGVILKKGDNYWEFIPNEKIKKGIEISKMVTHGLQQYNIGDPFIFVDKDNVPKRGRLKRASIPEDAVKSVPEMSNPVEIKPKDGDLLKLNEYFIETQVTSGSSAIDPSAKKRKTKSEFAVYLKLSTSDADEVIE